MEPEEAGMEASDAGQNVPAEEGGETPPSKPRLRGFREWFRIVFFALLIFIVGRSALLEAFKIPTASMEGTLLVGDFLLVNKAVYGAEIPLTDLRLPAFAEPARGEVIVFKPPHEPDKHFVKRVVAVAGDIVEMRDKRLIVNGREIDESYIQVHGREGDRWHPDMEWQFEHVRLSDRERRRYRPTRDTWGPLEIPDGKFFVLGDNRDNSEDSRYWGFVDRESIEGRPWMVYYSFDMHDREPLAWIHSVRWGRIGERID